MKEEHREKFRLMGRLVAYHRKSRNLTQMELAERTGISRTHMSNIEAPRVDSSISLDLFLRIADVLEVPPSSLLDFKEQTKYS